MQIAQRAYTAQREATSHSEASKKELPLKTKTTTTHRTETIKKMLSESGPESVLASKGRYSHTRTFAAGRDQRAVLAFSPENKRVDGFVVNKDHQLVPIKPYDLPKELQQILNSDAFEAFLNDVHARLIQLHNGDFRLDLHQGLKGGVHSEKGDINEIKEGLEKISSDAFGGRHESRVIIKNECEYPLKLKHYGQKDGFFANKYPKDAFKGKHNDKNNVIAPGQASGIFYNSNFGTPFGTKGYISIDVQANGRNFTVLCAFRTAFQGNNQARIQIKASDGNTNELGMVLGYAIDATGRVTNINELFDPVSDTHEGNDIYKESYETEQGAFQINYRFDNKTKAHFYFIFTKPGVDPEPPVEAKSKDEASSAQERNPKADQKNDKQSELSE